MMFPSSFGFKLILILFYFLFNVTNQQSTDFECYQCETDVFESVNDMEKDNCYTLKGIKIKDQNCTTLENVCSAAEYIKENSTDPTNK